MSAHKHAAVIAQFAELAQRMEHPETWVEQRGFDQWHRFPKGHAPSFHPGSEYRITDPGAHYVEINGERLEGPMTKPPEMGTEFWSLFGIFGSLTWDGGHWDEARFAEGRCFRTKEARDAMQTALTKLLTGGGS